MEAALLWAAIVGTALVLGIAVSFIRSRRFRLIALAVAFLFPPLFAFGLGLSDGCALKPSGEQCFGYGFGLVMAAGVLPVWIVLVIAGAWLKRRFQSHH